MYIDIGLEKSTGHAQKNHTLTRREGKRALNNGKSVAEGRGGEQVVCQSEIACGV